MEETSGAVAIVSGGMDSVTLAHQLDAQGYGLHLVSVDYGQRHCKELEFAKRTARRLGARHDVVDLRGLAGLLHGSALTDATVQVPDGHYAEASMRSTVVPDRNAILLSVAFGVAVAEGAELVAIGVHAGDHPIYPDCRPDFIAAFDAMQRLATDGYSVAGLRLDAPFVKLGKHDVQDRTQTGRALGGHLELLQGWRRPLRHLRHLRRTSGGLRACRGTGPDDVPGVGRMSLRITKEFHFPPATGWTRLEDGHPCGRLHGHNYVVELELSGRTAALDRDRFHPGLRDLTSSGSGSTWSWTIGTSTT